MTQRDYLIHMLFEEFSANGGTFISQDTDLLFKQVFWNETDTCNRDVFDRLLNIKRLR